MVYLVAALFIIAAAEAYIIGLQSFEIDKLSDKYLDAIQELEPVDTMWEKYYE